MKTEDAYLSPFSWRYGSEAMRTLWGPIQQRLIWRRIWVALAKGQAELGLVRPEEVEDLVRHQESIDLGRAAEIEKEIRHDLMAEVKAYAEQCSVGGGIIHLGATSMDILDNADAIRMRDSLDLLIPKLKILLGSFAQKIQAHADDVTMGFTHLQPAEPTTMGYRLAQYGQDLLDDLSNLQHIRAKIKGKGFKGATGTSASYVHLQNDDAAAHRQWEEDIMATLNLPVASVATQTVARKQEFELLSTLAGLGQSLYKFAFDIRLLQSPLSGEWSEPFGKKQVGSSAMPFKRNPIDAENIDSLARLLAALPRVAWDNAAHSLLERTLDDSANRRSSLPEAFLIADEILMKAQRIIENLGHHPLAQKKLLKNYGPFAATERLLMEAVKRGGDRQELHGVIRQHALVAWSSLAEEKGNPLVEALCREPKLLAWMNEEELRSSMNASHYIGDASERAHHLAHQIEAALQKVK